MSLWQRHFSKLPDVGTTIFTVMSRRAIEQGAVNVGQGFPDYPIDPRPGHLRRRRGRRPVSTSTRPWKAASRCAPPSPQRSSPPAAARVDPETELTVSCGGTESIYSAIQAVVGAGDEAIVFDPAYDAYDPAIRLAGGRCIHIPLEPPHFRYDWDRVRASLSERTRLIIINNPHNPACTVATRRGSRRCLRALTRDRPITVLADEVYEHVQYDGRVHQSVMNHEELRARSFAVYSFGKTLHITGWRVGYCVAPRGADARTAQGAPVQYLQHRRAAAGRHPLLSRAPPGCLARSGGVFQRQARPAARAPGRQRPGDAAGAGQLFSARRLFTLGRWPTCNDVEFTERLINEAGVAVIPLSPFYREPPANMRIVRLCVAKRDETLIEAARRISAYTAGKRRRTDQS